MAEHRDKRIEIRAHGLGDEPAERLELVHVDIEVARVPGGALQPPELRAKSGQLDGRENPGELTLNGAGAPDGDPELVQVLGVLP